VHLANLRVTEERRRKWTGFAVALVVTFTVCDAQQIGLSPSGGISLPTLVATVRTVLPEQKTPPVLVPMRLFNEAFASRKQASTTPRPFDGSRGFRYAWIQPDCWLNAPGSQPNSGQITRGPPRMDPPISC
jgi:hypothetical protein